MHKSGRRYKVSALVIVGNGDGYVGVGKATAVENRDAVEKAMQEAKLNVIPVKRGCGSWECACSENHSIPVKTEGKSGSVRVILMPAPKGIGLCVHDEAKKLLRLAGIQDIWTKCFGSSSSRLNYMLALFDALKKMNTTKLPKTSEEIGIENKIGDESSKSRGEE
jgi:small subunit ribosomal protein S5